MLYVVTFSPDGSKIASTSADNTIQLWDGATEAFIASLEGHSKYVQAITFSPDSSKIASASADNTVQLWNGATGEPISNKDDAFQFPVPLGHPLSLSIILNLSTSLWHITGSRLGNIDPAHIVPLCWFTGNIKPTGKDAFAYMGSHAALGCQDGCVMLSDIRKVCLYFLSCLR
jgi:WD40 repeat protein